MTPRLTCREVSEFLSDYVSDSLPPDVHEVFEGHVQACPNCHTYLTQYRETIAAGRLACSDEGVADCPEDLVRAVMAALQKEHKA